MASYAYPDVLVETQWVADHLDDPNVCLIEAAYDTEKYDLEHIPGALAWTWKQDFQHPIPARMFQIKKGGRRSSRAQASPTTQPLSCTALQANIMLHSLFGF